LYWQALEKGLDANLFFNGVDLDPLNRSYAMNFNFSSGMKAGIGYNLSQGTIFAEFLTISVNDHKNISTITDNWDMSLDILDLNFYRFSYVGKKLSFAPLIAGRIYWIDQSLNKTAKSPMDELRHITVSSKSKWALGPKIGVNSKWITNNYLDFFCNLAFVLSYQRIDMTIDADDFTFLADYFFKKHVIAPELEGIIGFSLGGYLGNNNNRHALLICGYEARVFFQQNYLTAQMTSLTQNIDGSIGNLTLHGLTASFRFDF
jgi:hypothetical protein